MAVTIEREYSSILTIGNLIYWVLSSDQLAQPNHRFVCRIEYPLGNFIGQKKVIANSDGLGIIRLDRFLRPLIKEPPVDITITAPESRAFEDLKLVFSEQFGDPPVKQPDSAAEQIRTWRGGNFNRVGIMDEIGTSKYQEFVENNAAIVGVYQGPITGDGKVTVRRKRKDGTFKTSSWFINGYTRIYIPIGDVNGGEAGNFESYTITVDSKVLVTGIYRPQDSKYKTIPVMFLNRFYFWQCVHMNYKSTYSETIGGEIIEYQNDDYVKDINLQIRDLTNGGRTKYNQVVKETIVLNSANQSDENILTFESLVESEKVIFYEPPHDDTRDAVAPAFRPKAAIVKDSSFTRKTIENDNVIQYTVSLEYAHNKELP